MALHSAVARQDLKEVETLLKIAHTNVNERDRTLQTPLHVACSLGSLPIVRELVNKNADVNATDTNNWTPLHCAANQSSDFDIILLLLDKPKINVTILSKDGTSMFHYLVRLTPKPEQIPKYTLALKKSLEKGVDINLAGKHAESPLHQATNRKNIVAVNFLLENNAFIDPKNKFGETPLFYAVKAQFLPLIHLFLSNHADYTAQSKDGSLIDFANNEIKQIISEYSNRNKPQNNIIINEPIPVNNHVNVNQNPPQVNYSNINPNNNVNNNIYNPPVVPNLLPINNNNNNIMHNLVQPVVNYTPEQLMLLQQQQHLLMLQYTSAVQTQFGILPMNCVKCNEMFCYPALAVSIKCPNPNCRAVNEIDRSKQMSFPPAIPPLPYTGVPYSPVYYPNNPVYMNMPHNSKPK